LLIYGKDGFLCVSATSRDSSSKADAWSLKSGIRLSLDNRGKLDCIFVVEALYATFSESPNMEVVQVMLLAKRFDCAVSFGLLFKKALYMQHFHKSDPYTVHK